MSGPESPEPSDAERDSALDSAIDATDQIHWSIERVGVVPSTMTLARQRAAMGTSKGAPERAPEGTVIVADAQTAGRGRRGRTWHSPPGAGLWCTVVLRPKGDRVETLGLCAGAAVLEALHGLGATEARLKWPNDILVGTRKLCGILLEAEGRDGSAPVVLLGIGINLRAAVTLDLPDDIRDLYIGLDELVTPGRTADDLLTAVLAGLGLHYSRWLRSGLESALEIWRRFDLLAGKRITAEGPDGPLTGVADGIDPSGALRLRSDASGEVVLIRAGEVRRVR